MTVEICCGDLKSVLAAKAGGAQRIELCSGLSDGGLTPSISLIEKAKDSGIEEINVLIRPRPGDFLYSKEELNLMAEDIRHAINKGATGVVFGVLDENGDVDVEAVKNLVNEAKKASEEIGLKHLNITFHRAFDVARDPEKSIEDIIEAGCHTLLTSGMAANSTQGIPVLKQLVKKAGGRIKIMAGGGINSSNVKEIIQQSGVDAIHSTARKAIPSDMKFHRKEVSMGNNTQDEYSIMQTSPEIVNELIQASSI